MVMVMERSEKENREGSGCDKRWKIPGQSKIVTISGLSLMAYAYAMPLNVVPKSNAITI